MGNTGYGKKAELITDNTRKTGMTTRSTEYKKKKEKIVRRLFHQDKLKKEEKNRGKCI